MPKITELWAWVAVDESGNEGVPAASSANGVSTMAMYFGDPMQKSQLEFGQVIANRLGQPVTLRKSQTLVDVVTVHPEIPKDKD